MALKVPLGCILVLLLVLPLGMAADPASQDTSAEPSDCCGKHRHRGGGHGGGRGMGPGGHSEECCGACSEGMASDARFQDDRELFHYLLDHRSEIRREVKMRDDGVETLTESSRPEVAEKIREHVASMYLRIEEGTPIHQRDPLFAELFRHTDKIRMKVKPTKKGVRVVETSDDPAVAALIQAHADVVTQFLENGHAEVHRNHALPGTAGVADEGSACPHRGRMAGGE